MRKLYCNSKRGNVQLSREEILAMVMSERGRAERLGDARLVAMYDYVTHLCQRNLEQSRSMARLGYRLVRFADSVRRWVPPLAAEALCKGHIKDRVVTDTVYDGQRIVAMTATVRQTDGTERTVTIDFNTHTTRIS